MSSAAAILCAFAAAGFGATALVAQPPAPGPAGKAVERRIAEIANRLEKTHPSTDREKELAEFVRRYLEAAAQALRNGSRFRAQRFADAADACRRPIDHLQRVAALPLNLSSANPSPPPPGPPHTSPAPPAPRPDPEAHLRQVYFRLRLSEVFLQQIPPPAPVRLLELARDFYEQGVRQNQGGKVTVADEYARAADDLTHALENLAQAALP